MEKLNTVDQSLIETGGHAPAIAQHCSQDEILRMRQRGLLVYVPTLLAFVSMFITTYYSSHSLLPSFIGGIVWAFIIFNFDKALMSSNAQLLSFSGVGRICCAIVSSLVVSECILLFLFADTIKEKNHKVVQLKIDTIAMIYNTQKEAEYNKYLSSQRNVEDKLEIFTKEIDGSGGSEARGWGIIGNEKNKAYQSAQIQFSADSITYVAACHLIDSLKQKEINTFVNSKANDIAGQLNTLSSITDKYINMAVWLLRILLLLIEMMPIFLKFSSKKSSDLYDKVLLLQSQKLMEELKLSSKLEMDILHEKSKHTESTAKTKANYDHILTDLDLYNSYMDELMAKQKDNINKDDADDLEGTDHKQIINEKKDKKWYEVVMGRVA